MVPNRLLGARIRPAGARVALVALLLGGLPACSPSAPEKQPVAYSKAPAASLGQDDPATYRGAEIAAQVCAQCHNVSTTDAQGPVLAAPSFLSVANRQGTSPESLSHWLTSSHPSMPNYLFTQQSVGDLVAYIMTLRGLAPQP